MDLNDFLNPDMIAGTESCADAFIETMQKLVNDGFGPVEIIAALSATLRVAIACAQPDLESRLQVCDGVCKHLKLTFEKEI